MADPTAGHREPAADEDPLSAGVLAALAAAGRPLSLTALRTALKASRPDLLVAVERLAAAGLVERRNASGRELVSRSGPA